MSKPLGENIVEACIKILKQMNEYVLRCVNDEEKGSILAELRSTLEYDGANITSVKNEAELSFEMNGNNYTIKLIKHRPKKNIEMGT